MQIQERYLLLRNLRTQDKENNPLTAEQVKENIAQALTSMDLNSTEFLKVGKNESKQSDKFEALYFAVVTFTTNDIAQKFL